MLYMIWIYNRNIIKSYNTPDSLNMRSDDIIKVEGYHKCKI